MGLFSKSKLGSDEYEILTKKNISLISEIEIQKTKLHQLELKINSLSGYVYQKLGKQKKEKEVANPEEDLDDDDDDDDYDDEEPIIKKKSKKKQTIEEDDYELEERLRTKKRMSLFPKGISHIGDEVAI